VDKPAYLEPTKEEVKPDLLFVYGILKRGLELDLEKYGQKFLGVACLPKARLYGIHVGVGLRMTEDETDIAHGELFQITEPKLWHNFLDKIENNGYVYTRRVVTVHVADGAGDTSPQQAWTYEHTYYPADFYEQQLVNLNGRYR
jgi:gamma-glutamylcyclotransferase (GGCT)/AIG2-like uncharacterized protein YtfP